jgi:hypothetical protein
MTDEEERLARELLFTSAERDALANLLLGVMVQHAEALGGTDDAISAVQASVRKAIGSIRTRSRDPSGAETDVSRVIQERIMQVVNNAAKNAYGQIHRRGQPLRIH